MKRFEAVIFDIDGTLSEEVSWTALTRDLGGSVERHLATFKAYGDGKIDYPKSKEELLGLWRATGNATKPLMEAIFADYSLREEAPALIRWLQDEGYLLALITGSMDVYAKVVAQCLGIKHYFANTELVFDDRNNLVDYHYELDQAKKKLVQFRQFCQANKLSPEGCVVVGNDDNDLELFRETGHGILLGKASHEIVQVAWKRVDSLDEVKELVSGFVKP